MSTVLAQTQQDDTTLTKKELVSIFQRYMFVRLRGTPARKRVSMLPFRWYGGKYSHLGWLLPLLPKATHFCEPFGGSGVVLLSRDPSPVETYNDIDSEVVNFFRVLRERPDELLYRLYLTPFSQEEFRRACAKGTADAADPIERARLFFVRAEQVRIGLAQEATPGRWAWCKHTSRRGMAGAVSRWLARVDNLLNIVERLRRVQIENRPAEEVIRRYDSQETLFYCDPPYPHGTRGDARAYSYEMTDDHHRELARTLQNTDGLVALSGYRCPLLDELYGNWTCIEAPTRIAHSVKEPRTEALWVNYEIPEERIRETGSTVVYKGPNLKSATW